MLDAGRDRQRTAEQARGELLRGRQRGQQLLVDQRAVIEVALTPILWAGRDVDAVLGIDLGVVLAKAGVQVPCPAGQRALEPGGDLKIAFLIVEGRQIAVGKLQRAAGIGGIGEGVLRARRRAGRLGLVGGGAEIARPRGIAPRISAVAVERHVRAERDFGVVSARERARGAKAQPLAITAVAGLARIERTVGQQRIEQGGLLGDVGGGITGEIVGAVLPLQVGADVQETAVVAQLPCLMRLHVLGAAILVRQIAHRLAILAVIDAEPAARVILLEDHVDHAGNRVRAILRRRTVLQNLDMVDGVGRDQVEVGRRAVTDVERGGVPAHAVHQNQRILDIQPAQTRAAYRRTLLALIATGLHLIAGQHFGERIAQILFARFGQFRAAGDGDRHEALFDGARACAAAGHHDRRICGRVDWRDGRGIGMRRRRRASDGQKRCAGQQRRVAPAFCAEHTGSRVGEREWTHDHCI